MQWPGIKFATPDFEKTRTMILTPIVFLIISVFTSILMAQEPSEEAIQKGKNILERISTRYSGYSCLRGNFSIINILPQSSKADTISGRVSYCRNKYRIETSQMEVVSDGTTRWVFFKDTKELQISSATSDDMFSNPYDLLTNYSRYFKCYLKTTDKKGNHIVRLVPLEPAKRQFHSVEVTVSPSSEVKQITVFMKKGNKVIYVPEKIRAVASIPDTTFSFNQDKAEEIIDLR